ncbi:Rieske 2Fe-2S domain-containing protein [Candidatus Uhrbacteria bacterium]|nr:Rieske 2Fe-2S domain-containing protein [Candidatus Uhrbacteria bacterium]
MQQIATIAELARIPWKEFVYRGRPAILVQSEDEIRAFYNICTHDGGCCALIGRDLVCESHGARFNPVSGKALSAPAPMGTFLTKISVRIEMGAVFVD